MFDDLDTALARLLDDPQAPPRLKAADVAFDTPEKGYQPAQDTAVNLFLFDVGENRDLRETMPLRDVTSGIVTTKRPPLRIDCSYLVTAWSKKTGAVKVQEEHRLLSEAFVWLNRFPVIPDQYFDFTGSTLKNPPFSPPAMLAQMNSERSLAEFWQALGISPRPAFYLTVTIAIDPVSVLETARQVATKQFAIVSTAGSDVSFDIGGTVRDKTTTGPLDAAVVTVRETGHRTVTDSAGRFQLSLLRQGQYTLDAVRSGYAAASKTIQVPGGSPTAFDLDLTPSP
jgi:Pvc16 N-terminal domain/Carboxypeptidase regulatory-like domain